MTKFKLLPLALAAGLALFVATPSTVQASNGGNGTSQVAKGQHKLAKGKHHKHKHHKHGKRHGKHHKK